MYVCLYVYVHVYCTQTYTHTYRIFYIIVSAAGFGLLLACGVTALASYGVAYKYISPDFPTSVISDLLLLLIYCMCYWPSFISLLCFALLLLLSLLLLRLYCHYYYHYCYFRYHSSFYCYCRYHYYHYHHHYHCFFLASIPFNTNNLCHVYPVTRYRLFPAFLLAYLFLLWME